MLRISVVNDPGTTRLKLEGKLAQEWVREAEKVWNAMAAMNPGSEIIVDLIGVSFVDADGQRLLAEMRHGGAELVGSGPLISALIDEIENAEAGAVQGKNSVEVED